MVISGLELWQWLEEAKTEAIASNISTTEIYWLLQELAVIDRLSLRLESFKNLPEIALKIPFTHLKNLWNRRVNEQIPIQYLTGIAYWRHFSLTVNTSVLIPRPETELIIDLAVEAESRQPRIESLNAKSHWVDLGTGSGAIALGLAESLTNVLIHAVDCSSQAIAVAQQNANNLGLADRIQFYQGSWWDPLDRATTGGLPLRGQISGMVSNPPYIPSSLVPQLQPEVAKHEPHLALDGGVDGLEFIRHLITTAPDYLRSGGIWLIEMMAGQADTVAEMLYNSGCYCEIEIHSDWAGIKRFAIALVK
ncbi:protein-(glutamine-N5) methyltransferase, release factor-specific [Oscillatoriales cyanobacterium USR001]|nr:protein-(glutamine-N5) methyltransferase, release factor-specific [Oscillatoriales cyanobacterium USR001]